MPATEAIVGIYGEVDRAVQLDPVARLRVSQLLPEYKTPGVRWYDDFLKWLADTHGAPDDFPRWLDEARGEAEPGEPAKPFPDVTAAFGAFTPNRVRDRARLMFATAVAARAFPQMKETDSELRNGAVRALGTFANGDELLNLLSDDQPASFRVGQTPGTRAWWKALVKRAYDLRLFSDAASSDGLVALEQKPCTARLVTVPGIAGPAAALRTEFDTEALKFKSATNFMAPENWKTCRGDFWCVMDEEPDPKLTPGQRRYHEVVSTDCDNHTLESVDQRAVFRAETRLLFNFMWIPTEATAQAAVANYELAEQPPHRDALIQVDEGSLVVSRLDWRPGRVPQEDRPENLRITTTKRIKFNYPFSSHAIALMVCALGWLETGAQLVACAAEGGDPMTGQDFDGEPATQAIKPRGERGERAAGSSGGLFHATGSSSGLLQEGVDIWTRALREGAAALERNLGGGPGGPRRRPPRKES